jgi:hypothetical protein
MTTSLSVTWPFTHGAPELLAPESAEPLLEPVELPPLDPPDEPPEEPPEPPLDDPPELLDEPPLELPDVPLLPPEPPELPPDPPEEPPPLLLLPPGALEDAVVSGPEDPHATLARGKARESNSDRPTRYCIDITSGRSATFRRSAAR